MTEPTHDPTYWKGRMDAATEEHHAVFLTNLAHWQRIEAKHCEILAKHVGQTDSVIDCACGWGRLLDLMPWHRGKYVGVDLSPCFIERAKQRHRGYTFYQASLDDMHLFIDDNQLDWAVICSVRSMVRRNSGDAAWDRMETEIRRVAGRLLFLEYDERHEGSVE